MLNLSRCSIDRNLRFLAFNAYPARRADLRLFPFGRGRCRRDWTDFFPKEKRIRTKGRKGEDADEESWEKGRRSVVSCPDTKWPLKRDFADMDRALAGGRRDRTGRNGELPEDGVGVAMATTIPQ